jgi:hypothetical protein
LGQAHPPHKILESRFGSNLVELWVRENPAVHRSFRVGFFEPLQRPFALAETFINYRNVLGRYVSSFRKVSADGRITQLWPIYEVTAGSRSFTALIQGGTNNRTGVGLLDGVIMDGWRTGDRVQVRFQTMTNCAGAPAGTCFQGTMRISRDKDKD